MTLPWILISTDLGPMIVNRLDYREVSPGHVIGVGAQLMTTGTYDQEEIRNSLRILDLLRHYRAPNGEHPIVALDGGANVGPFTLAWGKHMRGWGEVIAVEAQEPVFYALAGNVVLNNLGNVRCVHGVLGINSIGLLHTPGIDYTQAASFGSVSFDTTVPNDCGQDYGFPPDAPGIPLLNIYGLSLRYKKGIDLLKIDVEGMEMGTLRGAAEIIEKHRPIINAEHLKCGIKPLVELVESFGYTALVDSKDIWAAHRDDPVLKHMAMGGSSP